MGRRRPRMPQRERLKKEAALIHDTERRMTGRPLSSQADWNALEAAYKGHTFTKAEE